MMKEGKPISMRMTKKQIFNAGRENYHQTLLLREKLEHLEVVNLSLVNSLKWILSHVPTIGFTYDDGDVEEPEVTPPEKEKRDIEVA